MLAKASLETMIYPPPRKIVARDLKIFTAADLEALTVLPKSLMKLINEIHAANAKVRTSINGRNEMEKKLNLQLPNHVSELANQYYLSHIDAGADHGQINVPPTNINDTSGTPLHSNNEQEQLTLPRTDEEVSLQPPIIDNGEERQLNAPNTEKERDQNVSPCKRNNYYTEEDVFESKCLQCTWYVIHDDKVRKCLKCKNLVHDVCGTSYKRFERHNGNLNQGCFCKTCIQNLFSYVTTVE